MQLPSRTPSRAGGTERRFPCLRRRAGLHTGGRSGHDPDAHRKEKPVMNDRISTEAALEKDHAARQIQRGSTFVLNIVLAGIVLGAAFAVQAVQDRFIPWLTAVAVMIALVFLLSLRIALQ